MTANQVVSRIRSLSLAHKQIRAFKRGMVSDYFADQASRYPAVLLQDNGGNISTTGQAASLSFRLFFVDLVHVSEATNENDLDVQSDMVSVALDLIAEMNSGVFNDWRLSPENNLQLLFEGDNDLYGGCMVDISLRFMFKQNLCQIPTEIINGLPTDTDMKLVFDTEYVATGSEGSSLTIPLLQGKKVLMIIRENAPLHKVSNNPDTVEYVWDDTTISLGLSTQAGQRFLILYRTY